MKVNTNGWHKSDKLELQTLLSADEGEGERKSVEMNDSENLGRGKA